MKNWGIQFSGVEFMSFLQDFEMHLSEKVKSMLQSDQFDTLHLTHVVVVVSGFPCKCFLPNSFFLFPRKAKMVENEEKNINSLQKSLS